MNEKAVQKIPYPLLCLVHVYVKFYTGHCNGEFPFRFLILFTGNVWPWSGKNYLLFDSQTNKN